MMLDKNNIILFFIFLFVVVIVILMKYRVIDGLRVKYGLKKN